MWLSQLLSNTLRPLRISLLLGGITAGNALLFGTASPVYLIAYGLPLLGAS
jgi:hypothetical protein